MNTSVKNIIAVLAGLAGGSIVNMALVAIGPTLIPAPEGVNMTTSSGLKAGIHLMEPKNFLFPFLAHAGGTLAGAWIAAKFGVSHHKTLAMVLGAFFFTGGLMMIIMVPSPLWFSLTDLILAYFPMAWLGYKLTGR
jgi:hypothetical protein